MAIVDVLALGNLSIVVADADPSVPGNDIDAPQGSLVVLNTGAASFFKSGTGVNDWGTSILGTGTAGNIPLFGGTFGNPSGIIGNSSITESSTLITISKSTNITGGVYNNSLYATNGGLSTSSITWAGVSANQEASAVLNFGATISILGAGSNYVSVPILRTTITEGASGTHNLFAMLGVQAGVLNLGAATTTNAATVYIEGATTGTAGPTNNYALWVDDGITRLDGTAIINGADATTSSVKSAGYFQGSLTTGIPAVGIGTSVGFNTQTAASTYKLGSTITSVSTNVGTGTEAFDLAFANMTGGATATERMRILSTGAIRFNAYTTAAAFAAASTPVGSLMVNSSGNVVTQETAFSATSLGRTATEVITANTTPITLVNGVTGKIIVPHTLVFFLNSAGTAFATNTTYAWMLGGTIISATKSFAGTTDIYHIDTPTLTSGGTAIVGAPLQWKVQTGNPTGGGGATISIGVVYSLLTVS